MDGRSLVGYTVHGVAQSWTRLSDFTFTFHFHALEKEMATQSSILAWRIPGTGEPGGLPSMGSHRVRHDWSDWAAAAAAARFVIAFLPRSKRFLISWLQSPYVMILEPKKIKSVTFPDFSPSIWHELIGLDAMILVFQMLNFKPVFSLSSFTLSRGSLVPLHFLLLKYSVSNSSFMCLWPFRKVIF